jgi:ribokinase
MADTRVEARQPALVVVGSLIVDLVVRALRRPLAGETVFGHGFGQFLGGKGFNQAVAARRLGATVRLIGRVGDDDFGRSLCAALAREQVDASGVRVDPDTGTGVAMPLIDDAGQNSIVSVPRANMALTAADVGRCAAGFAGADALLLQLETPVDASLEAATLARAAQARVILNAAPAGDTPVELLERTDILIVNESEAAALLGSGVPDLATALTAAQRLRDLGPSAVVVTLGDRGAVAAAADGSRSLPAYAVEAVDPTGAGDAFCAALAVRLAETGDLDDALRWANAAGALAATQLGAEPSLPIRARVSLFIENGTRRMS